MPDGAVVWFNVRWRADHDDNRPERVIYVRRAGGGPLEVFVSALVAGARARCLDELDDAERARALKAPSWSAEPLHDEPDGRCPKALEVMPDTEGRCPVQEGTLFFGADESGEIQTKMSTHLVDVHTELADCGYKR